MWPVIGEIRGQRAEGSPTPSANEKRASRDTGRALLGHPRPVSDTRHLVAGILTVTLSTWALQDDVHAEGIF